MGSKVLESYVSVSNSEIKAEKEQPDHENKQCVNCYSTLFDKILPSSSSKFSTTGRVRNQKGLCGIQMLMLAYSTNNIVESKSTILEMNFTLKHTSVDTTGPDEVSNQLDLIVTYWRGGGDPQSGHKKQRTPRDPSHPHSTLGRLKLMAVYY